MAQHIPIESFAQKKFATIKQAIINDNKRVYGGLRGSLKYEQVEPNTFVTYRAIPNGIVYGNGKQCFEVHTENNKVKAIYMVA